MSHILSMAAPLAISMLAQIIYHLVNLYFVAKISAAATAGINATGNAITIVAALMQVLGIGTVTLVAHAAGRKDQADANLIFNQSMMLSAVCGMVTALLLWTFTPFYLRVVSADAATSGAGASFMMWMVPGLALSLPMTVFSSALRGIGIVRPTIAFYMFTVLVNAILAPVLIAGWGTGVALGVKGAGLATSTSIAVGVIVLAVYFSKAQRYMTVDWRLMDPQFSQWRRILSVGLPIGAEFALMFLSASTVYYALSDFGPSAQAGYGIGTRIMQTVLLPGMSIALAVGPIAGQNLAAGDSERVRETFRKALLVGTTFMVIATIFVRWQSTLLVGMFDTDALTSGIAMLFLQVISWSFVAQGLVYTSSSLFQGMGNTVPSLISSGVCFVAFATPVTWLSARQNFHIEQVWHVWIVAVTLQAVVSLCLSRAEFRRQLSPLQTCHGGQ